ncbi:lytic transglycosylase domain-containing protein [Geopsychrobacter electrodiphilus]|uniref:lytic transglycosylase domain-containing protein n=1 Tax=Geopsychrobacter electrodiphilus TaxID=225196 RepID=UPI000375B794|nr:lytic transglycosylase domain-containing protein [Geopsychrobacter electrodiphilus]
MRLLTATIILLLFASLGEANIYRYVDSSGRVHFTDVPTNTTFQFYRGEGESVGLASLIKYYAQRFHLDAALVKAMIKVESDFNPRVVSMKGAQGLMQLMPATAREVGVSDPFDPGQNIFGGTCYMRQMLDTFDSNLDQALAAYNAGPSVVQRYGGIPPYDETQNYVLRVKKYQAYYQQFTDQTD